MGNCVNCTNFHITREELKLGVISRMKIKMLNNVVLDKEYQVTMLKPGNQTGVKVGIESGIDFLVKESVLVCSEDLILTLESTASTFRDYDNPDYSLYEIVGEIEDDGDDEDGNEVDL